MSNIPKPELERGNFIAYADEPNTIVDNSGGGGGGGGFTVFNGTLGEDNTTVIVDFSFADIISAIGDGNPVFLYIAVSDDEKTMFPLQGTAANLGLYTVTFDVIVFGANDKTSTMTMQGMG